MVVFAASFAVLACLCAALPLAHLPGVEGAHLHGGRLMQVHSSSHSPHRTHSATHSATYTHGSGKHKASTWFPGNGHRSPGFPPLLRRGRADGHKKAHEHPGQGAHDRTHSKGHRSAFARSRYRRPSGPHARRSSVYVPGEHGNTYIVSRAPPRKWEHGQSSHPHHERQVDEGIVMGRIDIMGAGQSSDSTQRLASLTVDSTPIDWTSGQSSAKAFTMNASTSNQTQFIMMPVGDSSAGSSTKHVALATEVFDAGSTEMVMYCATYNPNPGSASVLLMAPCATAGQSAAQANDAVDPCANDASSSTTQESQIFSYDPSSGKLEPISTVDGADHLSSCGVSRVRRDGNSTTSVSTVPSNTSTSTAPTASVSQPAQSVTLVYVAGALEVPASPSSGSSSNTATSASAGQSGVLTTTITTTVVSTVATSGSSASSNRSSVSPAQAAASVAGSSGSSSSAAGATTPSVPVSSASRSSSSVPTSSTLTHGDQTLEVEIVGATPSTTSSPLVASASGTTTTTTISTSTSTTTTTPSSSTSASPSLDPQAVASLMANQMPHARRAFVTAAGNPNHP